jgi:hypothetical protein
LASSLNRDFTPSEILAAINVSLPGKSAGVDGVPMEFLKYATQDPLDPRGKPINVLVPHITYLFNKVLVEGYPSSWSTNALTPVPKPKGNPELTDDHRGIAVSTCLSKLYSLVILQRMDKWAEDGGLRAAGQAGFRHSRGGNDNAFILNTLYDKYKAASKPIYTAFIDFRKAYDSINRNILWNSLRSLGLHGRMMDTIISMYKNINIRVRLNGQLGDSFSSLLGVKQGDPLSPLLFGLFIDRLESYLTSEHPHIGVILNESLLNLLLYADDLVLMAETSEDLQTLLNSLSTFCDINSMTVNVKKTEALIFNPSSLTLPHPVQYNGSNLDWKHSFIYLGIIYNDINGIQGAGDRCLQKGRAALYSLVRRCHQLDLHNVHIKIHLFNTLVKPILMYGCEVWGPAYLGRGNTLYRKQLDKLHLTFLRQCIGVRTSTPIDNILLDLHIEPITTSIKRHIVGFWNRITSRPNGDIVKSALVDSCSLALHGKKSWAKSLSNLLPHLDILSTPQQKISLPPLTPPPPPPPHSSPLRTIPDSIRSNFKLLTYSTWFHSDLTPPNSTWWTQLNRPKYIRAVAQFRLGSHQLNIETQRWGRERLPRSLRMCKCCNLGIREDELHILYCPYYFDVRCDHNIHIPSDTNSVDTTMNHIMNNTPWDTLASFLIACFGKRKKFLENLENKK